MVVVLNDTAASDNLNCLCGDLADPVARSQQAGHLIQAFSRPAKGKGLPYHVLGQLAAGGAASVRFGAALAGGPRRHRGVLGRQVSNVGDGEPAQERLYRLPHRRRQVGQAGRLGRGRGRLAACSRESNTFLIIVRHALRRFCG